MKKELYIEHIIHFESDYLMGIEKRQEKDEDETPKEAIITSYTGIPMSNSMRVHGQMKSKNVTILIDIGAAPNFVSDEVVKEINVRTKEYIVFDVTVGDEIKLQSQCIYLDVEFNI